MRSIAVVSVLLMASAVLAGDTGFKKPYFGATRPGSFAKYKSTDDKGGVTENTYSRLPDQGGNPWIENVYEITAGQFKGSNSITSCLIGPSMVLEKELIDHLKYSKRCVSQTRGTEATEYPPDTIKAIATGTTFYGQMVVFKGTETVDGKPSDRYSYSYKANYMNIPAVTSGDLWLNDGVPFGLVKESSAIKDASGKVLTRWDMVLVQSGSGAKSALQGWSWGGATAETAPAGSRAVTATLAEAFEQGRVSLAGEVSGVSGRMKLTISNKGDAPLKLTLTRAPMRFDVGAPVDTLTLSADADKSLDIVPGATAGPFEMNQRGARLVKKGRFTVSREDGTPLFQGSVEVGAGRD